MVLPMSKLLDLSKLEAFADDKSYVVYIVISICGRIADIVGKVENTDYQHFSFSHNVFRSFLPQGR